MKEFFTGLFSSWKFWVVVALIIGAIFLFKAGVNKGVNTPPEDAPYPSEGKTDTQIKVFEDWAKTMGNNAVEAANSYFNSWYSKLFYQEMRSLMSNMSNMTDEQILWIAATYNRRYFKTGTFLKQVRDHKLHGGIFEDATAYNNVFDRLVKLGAK